MKHLHHITNAGFPTANFLIVVGRWIDTKKSSIQKICRTFENLAFKPYARTNVCEHKENAM